MIVLILNFVLFLVFIWDYKNNNEYFINLEKGRNGYKYNILFLKIIFSFIMC